ncbi:hypothetical protein AGMMS49975_03050 [Clostridia bacterium]|nr:hypothetical protein AGMMS49975_03050 [Clostridia bacterium]
MLKAIFLKIKNFLTALFKEIGEDEIISVSSEMTYKLILSIFPFTIFAMSIIGFMNLDAEYFLQESAKSVPPQLFEVIEVFVSEVVDSKRPGILSLSLALSVISSSSGFNAIMRGINKSYGVVDTRGFIKRRLISIYLTFIFAVLIVFATGALVYRDTLIRHMLTGVNENVRTVIAIFGFTGYFLSIFVMFSAVILIYKTSCSLKIKTMYFIPGALVTVIVWTFVSKVFNLYINNFSDYSQIYGSIGSVFILMIWVNILSIALLLGSEVNSLLQYEIKDDKTPKKIPPPKNKKF